MEVIKQILEIIACALIISGTGSLLVNIFKKKKDSESKEIDATDSSTNSDPPKSSNSTETTDTIIEHKEPVIMKEFILNTSEGKPNYSQRKSKYEHIQKGKYGENKINWSSLCNSHALIMAFLYAGWVCPQSDYDREPDAFADFVVKECLKDNNWFKSKMYNLWENWYEGAPDAYTPMELHDVLAHYAREWFKSEKADIFNAATSVKDVFKQLYENNIAVPTSVQWGGLAGHVVTIVGFKAPSETAVHDWLYEHLDCPITTVLIDDPWGKIYINEGAAGKYHGNESGNDVEIPYDFFLKHWKPIDSENKKFAHFIGKPAAFV